MIRDLALILGEGPTEFFYFKVLCDVFKHLTIKPDCPKHTNIKEFEGKKRKGAKEGGEGQSQDWHAEVTSIYFFHLSMPM